MIYIRVFSKFYLGISIKSSCNNTSIYIKSKQRKKLKEHGNTKYEEVQKSASTLLLSHILVDSTSSKS